MKKDEYETYSRIADELNGYTLQEGIAILITVLWTIIKTAAPTAAARLRMCRTATSSLMNLCMLNAKAEANA